MSFHTQHPTYPPPPPFRFLPLQSITTMPIHAPMLIQWLILPRPNGGHRKLKKFIHLRFQLFLRRNMRTIPPCLAHLCQIRIWAVEPTTSDSGDSEIEWSRSPAAKAASSGTGHNSQTANAADGEGERLMVHIHTVSINQWINVLSVGEKVRPQIPQIRQRIQRQIQTILGQKPNYGTKLKCAVSHTYQC